MSVRFVAVSLLGAVLPAQRVLEGPEPNESAATATVLPCGQEAVGTLLTFLDEDWYQVTLTAPTDLCVATGPTRSGEIGDTVVTLLDATGGPLRSNLNGVGSGSYSRLYASGLAAGTYYVSVARGVSGALAGGYVLDVRCQLPATGAVPAIVAEGAENNDPRSGGVATNTLPPARCSGALSSSGFDGDWDFWRVLLLADGVLRMRLDATAGQSSATRADDPVVYLFDGAVPPNVLAGPLYASEIDAWDQALDVRLAAGIYQVAVRGSEGSAAGSYLLDLTTTAAARVTKHAGGCGGRALGLATTSYGPAAPQSLELPQIGTTYALEGSNLGSGGIALHVVGLLPTLTNLAPFGAPGCTLEVVNLDTVLRLADAGGRATWLVTIPENPSLLGTGLESQAAVLDFSNPLGITLSNRVTSIVGG